VISSGNAGRHPSFLTEATNSTAWDKVINAGSRKKIGGTNYHLWEYSRERGIASQTSRWKS